MRFIGFARGVIALGLLLFTLQGCVYPIYKTLQPNVAFVVVDGGKRPIAGAKVTLWRQTFPYGHIDVSEGLITDEMGLVQFHMKSEWRTESLMIHGAQQFYWMYSATKEEFEETERTLLANHSASGPIEIVLSTRKN